MSDNTARSFAGKWQHNPRAFFEETLREGSDTQRWILGRNGFATPQALQAYLSDKRRILDAGCGNGRVTALLRRLAPETAEIVGIDLVAAEVARRNLADMPGMSFETRDLLADLSGLGRFDFIYSQEVLHHTADPRRAFLNLCALLEPAGEIAIYVYKAKAPVREFVDDFVRERISRLPYEDAMRVSREIAALGRALAAAGAQVKVPAVPLLGIEAGEYDVQRFIYHFFMKCYWNADLTFEENALISYDWYHPQDATRHTVQEVEAWFRDAGLAVTQKCVDFYGITMRGKRP